MTYEQIKAALWPHFLVPLAVIVLLEYVQLLAVVARIGAASYLMVYSLGFAVGIWAGLMGAAGSEQWKKFTEMKITEAIPSIKIGAKLAVSMVSTEDESDGDE